MPGKNCWLFVRDISCHQWRQNVFESGGTGPERKRWGTDMAQSAGKFVLGCAHPLFGSKSTASCFGECFRDGQYSLVNFLFAVPLGTHGAPCAQPFVKVGGTCAPLCPVESASLVVMPRLFIFH